MSIRFVMKILMRGARRRCPSCGIGDLCRSHFQMHRRCPQCGVVYWRDAGECVGVMDINAQITAWTFVFGWVMTEMLTTIPFAWQLAFWSCYAIIFPILFLPVARGIWTSIVYLFGGVTSDGGSGLHGGPRHEPLPVWPAPPDEPKAQFDLPEQIDPACKRTESQAVAEMRR
jgi:uncharacterized protein (DUF983 family)